MATTYLPYSGPGYPDYSAVNASIQSGLNGLVQAQRSARAATEAGYDVVETRAREDRAERAQEQDVLLQLSRERAADRAASAERLVKLQGLMQKQRTLDLETQSTILKLNEQKLQQDWLVQASPHLDAIEGATNPVLRQIRIQDLQEKAPGFTRFAPAELKQSFLQYSEQDSKVRPLVDGVEVSSDDLARRIRKLAVPGEASTRDKEVGAVAIAAYEILGGSRGDVRYPSELDALIDAAKDARRVQHLSADQAVAEKNLADSYAKFVMASKRKAGFDQTFAGAPADSVATAEHLAMRNREEQLLLEATLDYQNAMRPASVYGVDVGRITAEIDAAIASSSGDGSPGSAEPPVPARPSPVQVAEAFVSRLPERLAAAVDPAMTPEEAAAKAAEAGQVGQEFVEVARAAEAAPNPYTPEGRAALTRLAQFNMAYYGPLAALGLIDRPLDPALFYPGGYEAVSAASSAGVAERKTRERTAISQYSLDSGPGFGVGREINRYLAGEAPSIMVAKLMYYPGTEANKALSFDEAVAALEKYRAQPLKDGSLPAMHRDELQRQLGPHLAEVPDGKSKSGTRLVPLSEAPLPQATKADGDGLLHVTASLRDRDQRASSGQLTSGGIIRARRDRAKELSVEERVKLAMREFQNIPEETAVAALNRAMRTGETKQLEALMDSYGSLVSRTGRAEYGLVRPNPRVFGEYRSGILAIGAAQVAGYLNDAFAAVDSDAPVVEDVAAALKNAAEAHETVKARGVELGLSAGEARMAALGAGAFGASPSTAASRLLDEVNRDKSELSVALGDDALKKVRTLLRHLSRRELTLGVPADAEYRRGLETWRTIYGDAAPGAAPGPSVSTP